MMKPRIFAIVLVLFLLFSEAYAQQLHFYNFRPSRDSSQTSKIISSYNIGSDDDLYILLSPGTSLQRELTKLAPQLDNKEVLAKGNYTFDFFIDGQKVYTENLHPGAILQQDKLIDKPLDIVFVSSTRSGIWSINLWDRFMAFAGITHFGKEAKELTIKISTYLDDKGLRYGPLLAKAQISITRIPKIIDPLNMRPQAIAEGSGFRLSHVPIDSTLITLLNTKIADQSYPKVNGIVVLHKGKLLIEQYYNRESRESLHDPRSVSKSITSTLVGMAIKDGFIRSENQTLREFYDLRKYANYSLEKDNVRLVDLLSMSSAFDGNDDVDSSVGNEENMYPTADYTKFALDLPMDSKRENGKSWSYFTAGTNLLMDILDKCIPEGIEAYAQNKLFAPLGIKRFEWARTPQGKPFGGGGLRLRALDFAKYGQLYQNKGTLYGKRIISKNWVNKSFSKIQVLPADRPGFYGLLFWNKVFKVNGKPLEVYYSSGNGGNKIYVFKELPIVIVITASAYGKAYAHIQADEIVEKYLLPAIVIGDKVK